MSSLNSYITSGYMQAAQKLRGQKVKHKIVAYVESYDDVLFWRNVLGDLETKERYFEVMLPSRTSLQKGKKTVLMNALSNGLGPNLIACVDADYDYLLNGCGRMSEMMKSNRFIFHTYAYAIENFQCYAASLHEVCVMATLNDDHSVFDFQTFMEEYSKIVWPLFVWSVWAYRYGRHGVFSMADFAKVISLQDVNLFKPEPALEKLQNKVNSMMSRLQNQLPEAKITYKPFSEELQNLGVTPETTYLYMRGHDLLEKVVEPLLEHVCAILRKRREKEINTLASHDVQRQNEISGYQHASSTPLEMLRKQTNFYRCPLYKKIQEDVVRELDKK